MQNPTRSVGSSDIFRNLGRWTAKEARYWADALNQRAAARDQIGLRAYILEQSGLKSGETVLELGCGTGRLLSDLTRVASA